MTASWYIRDGAGSRKRACVHERDGVGGLVIYNRDYEQWDTNTQVFVNPLYGPRMNQNAAFGGGTPVLVHNGGDSAGWTGTADAGTWDFASATNPYAGAACVELTDGDNNDKASFTSGSGSISGSSYTAITMYIRLDTYSESNNDITIQALNSAVAVGTSVTIDTYINATTIGSYQAVVIPLVDMGIDSLDFDEFEITLIRSGGSKPVFRIDNFQIEETGGAIEFTVTPDLGELLHIFEIRLTFADAVTGSAGQSYNKILGETLTGGFLIRQELLDGPQVGRAITSVLDMSVFGFAEQNRIDDGTNTMVTYSVKFDEPIKLDGEFSEKISFRIQQDMTGFLEFRATARGKSRPKR